MAVISAGTSRIDDNDVVYRNQVAVFRSIDEKTPFNFVNVTIDFGLGGNRVKHPIKLRYAQGSRFLFAVFRDQSEDIQEASRDEWSTAGSDALEKYCALHDLSIKFGPRGEDTNRYNMMVETNETIIKGNGVRHE